MKPPQHLGGLKSLFFIPWMLGLLTGNLTAELSPGVQQAEASSGMIVAGHPAAVEAGLTILRQGGNAMDAAVAVSLALGVAEPYGSGIGGKLLFLYYEASSGEVSVIDALDAAPHSFDVEGFRALSAEQRRSGWTSVAVPGSLKGLEAGHRKWGILPWEDCVQPAVQVATEGFKIFPKTHLFLEAAEFRLGPEAASTKAAYFDEEGRPRAVEQVAVNGDLAKTLSIVARDGADAFYRGTLGEKFVTAALRAGVTLTVEDLAAYQVRIEQPGRVEVNGGRLWVAPPPAVGGILAGSYFQKSQSDGADRSSLVNSAAILAYAERLHRLFLPIYAIAGDEPEAASQVWAWWQSQMPDHEDMTQKTDQGDESDRPEDAFTTHFVIGDTQGNVLSATQSLSSHFGAGVEIPGTGIILNNTLKNFAILDRQSVNRPAPGKRPRTTIAPIIWKSDTGEVLALGLPGGARIPTGTIQILQAYFDGRPMAEAIRQARVHVERPRNPRRPRREIVFEDAPSDALTKLLEASGWVLKAPESPEWFGGACALLWNGEHWTGLADQRRTNAAAGIDGPF